MQTAEIVRPGRTAKYVTDQDEIRKIALLYKGHGGSLTFHEIELIKELDLRESNGMTAMRVVEKFNKILGGGAPPKPAARIQPVSVVPDEDRKAILFARRTACEAPVGCWESYWKGLGLPEPKATLPAPAAPELTEQQLAEQAASQAALARLGSASPKALVPAYVVTEEERAWGLGYKAGFEYSHEDSSPQGKLAQYWYQGREAGRRGKALFNKENDEVRGSVGAKRELVPVEHLAEAS